MRKAGDSVNVHFSKGWDVVAGEHGWIQQENGNRTGKRNWKGKERRATANEMMREKTSDGYDSYMMLLSFPV